MSKQYNLQAFLTEKPVKKITMRPGSVAPVKRVLIDIKHPAQLNLFKGLSKELVEENWDVTISYLNRGKLPSIIASDYSSFKRIEIGKSNGSRWSIIWDGNIRRMLTFLKLILRHKYNICVSVSSIPLALACSISGTPIIQFSDDPERRRINKINALLSTHLFFPPVVSGSKKISIFNCLKEWSYLSPLRFTPNPKVLEKYGLKPYEYIFMREVSNKSFNYYNQQDSVILSFSSEIDYDRVVLSLEDKSAVSKFPKHWIILNEPVEDIHSLIYYSRLVLSSGDSMAREGALLGVPGIYCGIREMKANTILMERGMLKHAPGREALQVINEILKHSFCAQEQLEKRKELAESWDDMIVYMKAQVNKYKH